MEFQIGDIIEVKSREELKRDLPPLTNIDALCEKLAPFLGKEYKILEFYKNGRSVRVNDVVGFSVDLVKLVNH